MSTVAQGEKRGVKRVEARVPIALEWNNGRGMLLRTRGVTRDLSRGGVYCFVDDPVPSQHPVEFDVVFPEEMTASAPLALHCCGKTVRTQVKDRRFGVAASIESREVLPLEGPGLKPERRVRRRVIPDVHLAVEYPGLTAHIRDLSATGAYLADERPLPVGRKLDLRIRIDASAPPLEVQAVVRRADPQMGMAVEFISLPESAAARLRQMVNQKHLPTC